MVILEWLDIISICKYLLDNNPSKIWLDTNGGMQTEEFWYKLSQLSFKHNHKLNVGFNIDGYKDTNHIYRVNVIWDKLIKNISAYSKGKGKATWSYIEFDHNTNDIDNARQLAKDLGFNFRVRRSSRNQIKAPWKTTDAIITTNKKDIQHTQAQAKFNITKKIENTSTKHTKFNDIKCRLIHEQKAYISHDMKLWPCCWIGDMYHDSIRPSVQKQGRQKLFDIEKKYGKS